MGQEFDRDSIDPWPAGVGFVAGFGGRSPVRGQADFVTVKQVHGIRVFDATDLAPGFHDDIEADALCVSRTGPIVAVRTADCVPILLIEPDAGWAAAVHSGWRGTLAAAVRRAVLAARQAGVETGSLKAAIGPAIGPCCYEVGEDVAERFAGDHVERREGRFFLDLVSANRSLLRETGVVADNISTFSPCTRCNAERFHSVRADRFDTGRQLSWVGFRAADA